MCFDPDSRPPITPIAGGAVDARVVTLMADDGARIRAFRARAAEASGAGIVVVPDVRGLHPYYEELAQRFAESDYDAVAIDLFGRTAGTGPRGDDFDAMPHVQRTTWDGLAADVRAAVAYLRSPDGGEVNEVFVVGFCFGGRIAFVAATLGLDLAGVIGFYGRPRGPGRWGGVPAPVDVADVIASPVLGLYGGADEGIPAEDVAAFDEALERAGVPHRLITYPEAPHSFFDRKAEQFAAASAAAWDEVLAFVRERGAQIGA